MGAMETQLNIYNDCDSESDEMESSFNPGESDTHFSIEIRKGEVKQVISVDKDDAIMMRQWLESIIPMMVD